MGDKTMTISRPLRLIRKSLSQVNTADRRSPSDLGRAATEVILLSRFYYLYLVFAIGSSILPFDRAYMGGPPTSALWPIDLIEQLTGVGWLASSAAVSAAGLGAALLATVSPRVLLWRLGVFLYVLLHVALRNSYGSINHGSYFYLYVGFALLFLPSRDRANEMTRKSVLSCLAVFWLTQSILLLPYTLSGLWRIWSSRLELLSLDGMVRILLNRAIDDTAEIGPLLPFVVEHQYLAQAMLLMAVYVETFALLAVFRPHLHRPFGILLIFFHIGSDWLMNISFAANILMIGLFLVMSPMAPARFSLSGLMRSLPLVGIPLRIRVRLRSSNERQRVHQAWLVYDGECPLCRNYTQYVSVKAAVQELVLVDAREGGPLVEEIRNLPHDLNEGMVLKLNGRYYIGHRALNVLALLSEKRGGFSRVNRLVFSSPLAARLGYPLLKFARWLLLRMRRIPPLD